MRTSVFSILLLAVVGCAQVAPSIHTMNRKERIANQAFGSAASQLCEIVKELGDANNKMAREIVKDREDAFIKEYTDASGKLSNLNAATLRAWVKARDDRLQDIRDAETRVSHVYGSMKSTTSQFVQMQRDMQVVEDQSEEHEKEINAFLERAVSGISGATLTAIGIAVGG